MDMLSVLHCNRLVTSYTRQMRCKLRISAILSAGLAIENLENVNAFVPVVSAATHHHLSHTRMYMTSSQPPLDESPPKFKRGDSVQVEVLSFGPLGASVDIVGVGHSPDNLISENEPALGQGLVLQREIHYFRQARNNVDVIRGEVLPAYVEKVRDDGNIDIALRTPGGKAKADQVGKLILERLEWEPSGRLPLGDKSPPELIGAEFPGVSKGAFKKAVSALYKQGIVKPGPHSIELMNKKD